MPQRAATIRTVAKACRMIKEMSSQGVSWSEDYRSHGRDALKAVLEERMKIGAYIKI